MIWEKNNLLTVQECTKPYIELTAFTCTPKKYQSSSITFNVHNGSWSQYIRPGKQVLGKQIRQNFFRLTSLLYKILLANLGACKPTFYTYYTSHLTVWGETVLWGAVFIIQTSDRMQYFTVLKYKLHSFNIQDDRSTRGLLAKPLKKFPKSLV